MSLLVNSALLEVDSLIGGKLLIGLDMYTLFGRETSSALSFKAQVAGIAAFA